MKHDANFLLHSDDVDRLVDKQASRQGFSRNDPQWLECRKMLIRDLTLKGYYKEKLFTETDVIEQVLEELKLPAGSSCHLQENRKNELIVKYHSLGVYAGHVDDELLLVHFSKRPPSPEYAFFSNDDPVHVKRDRLIKKYKIAKNHVVVRRRQFWKKNRKHKDHTATVEGSSEHHCNIVVAYVACSRCMDDGSALRDENNSCPICFSDREGNLLDNVKMPSRFLKWSAAEINDDPRPGKPKYSASPLESFAHWLFEQTNPRFDNFVFAHYGYC